MQIEKFEAFALELNSNQTLLTLLRRPRVFRFHNKSWFDEVGEIVSDPNLRQQLARARQRASPLRTASNGITYFPIRSFDAVVTGAIPKPVTRARLNRCLDVLQSCITHADNAFHADHDTLTGLLNRGGFEKRLEALARVWDTVPSPSSAAAEAPEKAEPMRVVSLFVLDIDHFKQVNDSYGHEYGDLVLQCFAKRLQETANVIEAKYDGVMCFLARPGGEEFSIVVQGAISSDALVTVGETLREAIANTPLPSDEEWGALPRLAVAGIRLPHITERRITASVGFSTYVCHGASDEIRRSLGELRRHADAALYRAKAGGRNTVRDFAEILLRYGRVLEQHQDTGIVTIDIGALVGVNFGQEFLVYHPDFAGGVPFVQSDGRTRKRLGDYPKVPYGRITVFDVQNEVSFCRPADRLPSVSFAIGCVLEALPTGSVPHILPTEGQANLSFPGVVPGDELPKALVAVIDKAANPFVAVFAIKDLTEVGRRRGHVFINDALSKLHQAISDTFRRGATIGQPQPTEFAVILDASTAMAMESNVAAAIALASQKCTGQVAFKAGICDFKSADYKSAELRAVERKNALELARYALSDEARSGVIVDSADVQAFEIGVASRVVYASRAKREYAKALEDYKRFVECGIRSGYLENQAALCFHAKEDPDYAAAVGAAKRAVEYGPTDRTLHANLGYFYFHNGELPAAYDAYQEARSLNPELLEVYWVSYALVCAANFERVLTNEARKEANEALARALEYARRREPRLVKSLNDAMVRTATLRVT